MRRPFSLVLCAVWLAFGTLAGLGHLHPGDPHGHGAAGLHLDHGHLRHGDRHGHGQDHGHGHDHGHEADGAAHVDPAAIDHHGAGAVSAEVAGIRPALPAPCPAPAVLAVRPEPDPPPLVRRREDSSPRQPRDPPDRRVPRLRAPPA